MRSSECVLLHSIWCQTVGLMFVDFKIIPKLKKVQRQNISAFLETNCQHGESYNIWVWTSLLVSFVSHISHGKVLNSLAYSWGSRTVRKRKRKRKLCFIIVYEYDFKTTMYSYKVNNLFFYKILFVDRMTAKMAYSGNVFVKQNLN